MIGKRFRNALLRRITSTHVGGFHFLSYFHSFRTKNKIESYEESMLK